MQNRREFLRSATTRLGMAGLGIAGLGATGFGIPGCGGSGRANEGAAGAAEGASPSDSDAADPEPDTALPFRISLAQWSLHRRLFGQAGEPLDALDFAAVSRSFGIDAIEYVNVFFFEKAKDAAYLGELTKRADAEGVKNLLIMVDREGYLGHPDEAERDKAVENHRKWVDAAKALGCHSIRVNARSDGTREEQLDRAADGLRRVTEIGAEADINVIVENHGGLSSDGSWLAALIEKVDHPRCGTLPDFGNFRIDDTTEYDRYQGVRELMPYAKAVSAKSNDFDDDGNETKTDFARMMRIVTDAGYHGYVGIEYEGSRLPEMDGVRATLALLERVRDELAVEKG